MLSDKEFTDEMNRLSDRFPGANNKQVLRRVYMYVKDLPAEGLVSIVDGFIDSSRQAPLPNDFEKAATQWRGHYFLKTGIYYGASIKANEPTIDCAECQDLGIVKSKDKDFKLFRCDCLPGRRCMDKFPVYRGDLKKYYEIEALPYGWFKPGEFVEGSPIYSKMLTEKGKDWTAFKKKKELEWKSEGYEYETSNDRWGWKE